MARKRSTLQNYSELLAVRLILGTIGLLPLGASMRVGKFIGRQVAKVIPKLNRTAHRNLEIAFPEMCFEDRVKIASGTIESLGRQLGFVSHFWKFTKEDIRDLVVVDGREHFDRAIETGRGILLFTGHFGSWEIYNLLPPAFGYELNILVRRIDNQLVEDFVEKLRTQFGSVTLDKTKAGRQMFRILGKGQLLGILADLNVQEKEGIFVDFFGVPASTTTGIAKLAIRTNAIVLPTFAVWHEEWKKYIIHIEPPLDYAPSDNSDENVRELTQNITTIVEKYVRRYPEQWLWIHKRWNTRPKGEKGLY